MKDKLLNWLNLFLMIDLFLVFLSFFWLAIAVGGKAAGIPLGIELWYKLWNPLFMPIIGIFMAGALMSGLFSQISKLLKSNS